MPLGGAAKRSTYLASVQLLEIDNQHDFGAAFLSFGDDTFHIELTDEDRAMIFGALVGAGARLRSDDRDELLVFCGASRQTRVRRAVKLTGALTG